MHKIKLHVRKRVEQLSYGARGYILRRVTGYGFPNAPRMTIGTEEANRGLIAALTTFLKG
ncbi:hypothetical protein X729_30995 [Mesorhizobium sp. L103C131B0]|nr:hypothetical protein X729_30995 [Mesorhizobium sp. L103C131B0]